MIDVVQGCRYWLIAGAVALFSVFAVVHADQGLNASQSRGKQIYLHGTSDSGEDIMATVGAEGLLLPASSIPCANCHGRDGKGRREGGIIPPDIRWSELTKGYGHVHENGRTHDAFTDVSLARLIRSGRDPAHNQIETSMPRYAMSKRDMDDLVAYLQVMEHDLDPGLAEDRIQVATLLPLLGGQAKLGGAMAQVMLAYFNEINKNGGVYGRKVDLLAIPYGVSPEDTLQNLRSAFTREGIFALVGAYTVGMDDAILEVLRGEEAPQVGPFTLNPGDQILDSSSFYLYPGFEDQVRTLVQLAYTKQKKDEVRIAVVGPQSDSLQQLIDATGDLLPEGLKNAGNAPLRYPAGDIDASALADVLEQQGSNAILFLGTQPELEVLLGALDARKLYPKIYGLSAYISRPLFEAPSAFDKRIFLAYPTLSSDLSTAGRAEYLRLADLHALPRDHLQAQIAALAASKLLVEGLRGAGRTLSRQKLVEAIEALYRYDTGMTPPLTYGPNRRVGARGAHVMTVDLEKKSNVAVGGWHEIK